ncbi:Plasmodium exported protein, unknown function [Plasmodium vivax]|uniref:Variable surface protein Vir35 n=1 Tax=Plasmodium vivax TaxID=5855 RepID=A0A565A471_PLAVI|nr:Plasmodium exported protein, unknown function [Plasmodium vivax]
MGILWHYNITENMKFIFILKFFTLSLLTWICYLKSDKLIFGRHLENEYKLQGISEESINRILAKYEIQEELKYPRTSSNLSNNTMNKNAQNVLVGRSTCGLIGKKEVNDLDEYMKGCKRRYSKKNVLGKLDCYCEKKLFDKMDDIYNIVSKLQNDKKKLKKKLYNIYGTRFIIIALVPLLGLIIPFLFSKYSPLKDYCDMDCTKSEHKITSSNNVHNDSKYPRFLISENALKTIYTVNNVFLGVIYFGVLLLFLYVLIKYIKYEKLRVGKVRGK